MRPVRAKDAHGRDQWIKLAAEAARGLRMRGCEVTIVEAGGSFDRQLEAVLGSGRVEAVRFMNGEVVAADLVVIATNLQPNTLLARSAGLQVNRGIVVNNRMETSDRYIFSLGICAETLMAKTASIAFRHCWNKRKCWRPIWRGLREAASPTSTRCFRN